MAQRAIQNKCFSCRLGRKAVQEMPLACKAYLVFLGPYLQFIADIGRYLEKIGPIWAYVFRLPAWPFFKILILKKSH